MKNLKAKNILFNLLTMMVFTIFLTSCGQDVFTTTDSVQNVDLQELAQQISESENYKSVQEVRAAIFDDLINFYDSNRKAIENNPAVFDNYLSTNTKFDSEVFEAVNNINTVVEKSCWAHCNELYLRCDSICYDRFLWFPSFTYYDYLFCNRICAINVYYSCIDDC